MSEKIKQALPDNPTTDSRNTTDTRPVTVKAGEIIGYSIGEQFEQWDFGVYNKTLNNNFSNLTSDIEIFDRDRIADCPYDYFPEEMRRQYYLMFDNHLANVPVPNNICIQ